MLRMWLVFRVLMFVGLSGLAGCGETVTVPASQGPTLLLAMDSGYGTAPFIVPPGETRGFNVTLEAGKEITFSVYGEPGDAPLSKLWWALNPESTRPSDSWQAVGWGDRTTQFLLSLTPESSQFDYLHVELEAEDGMTTKGRVTIVGK